MASATKPTAGARATSDTFPVQLLPLLFQRRPYWLPWSAAAPVTGSPAASSGTPASLTRQGRSQV